jgi:hypothetical protein
MAILDSAQSWSTPDRHGKKGFEAAVGRTRGGEFAKRSPSGLHVVTSLTLALLSAVGLYIWAHGGY